MTRLNYACWQCVLSAGTHQPAAYPVAGDAPALPLEAGMCWKLGQTVLRLSPYSRSDHSVQSQVLAFFTSVTLPLSCSRTEPHHVEYPVTVFDSQLCWSSSSSHEVCFCLPLLISTVLLILTLRIICRDCPQSPQSPLAGSSACRAWSPLLSLLYFDYGILVSQNLQVP